MRNLCATLDGLVSFKLCALFSHRTIGVVFAILAAFMVGTPSLVHAARFQTYFSPASALDQTLVHEIKAAQKSIDLAIYTFSSPLIRDELLTAQKRGVKLRLIVRRAIESMTPGFVKDLADAGAEIRWVTKINHHKFVLIDGETLLNSSGNFSETALQRSYDENLVVCTQCPSWVKVFQEEFDFLFHNSNPLYGPSDVVPERLVEKRPKLSQKPPALFSSRNFHPEYDAKRQRVSLTTSQSPASEDLGQVESRLIEAIDHSQKTIRIATGHFRSWPLLQALVRASKRGVRVTLMLDSQEYVSSFQRDAEEQEVQACLQQNPSEVLCRRIGSHYSRHAFEAGIDVRIKFYALRWSFLRAPQMHHKYMIIDDQTLYSGSYNWSFNAEFESTENVLISSNSVLVDDFQRNFQHILNYGAGAFTSLRDQIRQETKELKYIYPALTLTYPEIDELQTLACAKCPQVFCSAPANEARKIDTPSRENRSAPLSCKLRP